MVLHNVLELEIQVFSLNKFMFYKEKTLFTK